MSKEKDKIRTVLIYLSQEEFELMSKLKGEKTWRDFIVNQILFNQRDRLVTDAEYLYSKILTAFSDIGDLLEIHKDMLVALIDKKYDVVKQKAEELLQKVTERTAITVKQ